jgi:hypothetical protein
VEARPPDEAIWIAVGDEREGDATHAEHLHGRVHAPAALREDADERARERDVARAATALASQRIDSPHEFGVESETRPEGEAPAIDAPE